MPKVNRQKSRVNADALNTAINKQLTELFGEDPAWKVINPTTDLYVWRIENYKPVLIPQPDHGIFFDGDSYIVLHSHQDEHYMVNYDIFIWIGDYSTADEYGTAASKMSELDSKVLKGSTVQHREVQGHESPKFLSLFKQINIQKGGVTSGFHTVEDQKSEPKLLRISGDKKNIRVEEISFSKDNITADDVFVVDLGENIYVFNGKKCSKEEKFRGILVTNGIKAERPKVKLEIIDGYKPGKSNKIIDAMPVGNKEDEIKKIKEHRPLSLWRFSDSSGTMELTEVSTGICKKSSLDPKDVFILDANDKIFVWVGKKTSKNEQLHALVYAQKYAETIDAANTPLVKVSQGKEPREMKKLLT